MDDNSRSLKMKIKKKSSLKVSLPIKLYKNYKERERSEMALENNKQYEIEYPQENYVTKTNFAIENGVDNEKHEEMRNVTLFTEEPLQFRAKSDELVAANNSIHVNADSDEKIFGLTRPQPAMKHSSLAKFSQKNNNMYKGNVDSNLPNGIANKITQTNEVTIFFDKNTQTDLEINLKNEYEIIRNLLMRYNLNDDDLYSFLHNNNQQGVRNNETIDICNRENNNERSTHNRNIHEKLRLQSDRNKVALYIISELVNQNENIRSLILNSVNIHDDPNDPMGYLCYIFNKLSEEYEIKDKRKRNDASTQINSNSVDLNNNKKKRAMVSNRNVSNNQRTDSNQGQFAEMQQRQTDWVPAESESQYYLQSQQQFTNVSYPYADSAKESMASTPNTIITPQPLQVPETILPNPSRPAVGCTFRSDISPAHPEEVVHSQRYNPRYDLYNRQRASSNGQFLNYYRPTGPPNEPYHPLRYYQPANNIPRQAYPLVEQPKLQQNIYFAQNPWVPRSPIYPNNGQFSKFQN